MYKSPYEAYPFLSDADDDLRCDFEIATDRLASQTGMLRACCPEDELQQELLVIEDLIYHFNPTLRTFFSLTEGEVQLVAQMIDALRAKTPTLDGPFVLPSGSYRASLAHVLRTDAKALVRLIYRHLQRGGTLVDQGVDFANLLSGYFFHLALYLNHLDGVTEIPYTSRNYKSK